MSAGRLVGVVTLMLLAAACDPGTQSQPEAIPRRDVPFGLLDTTSTTAEQPETGAEPFTVYLAANDRLVAVNRSVDGTPQPAAVLHTLLDGPTPAEARYGIVSAIPSGTRLRRVTRRGSVLTIDLARDFFTNGEDSKIAVAQLVWTATGLPGIEAVRFRVGGTPVQVPTGSGALGAGALTREDFPQVAP
jgi:spore germination protein GerM